MIILAAQPQFHENKTSLPVVVLIHAVHRAAVVRGGHRTRRHLARAITGLAIGNVLIFAAIGIVAAIIGFKVFDKCTPGHLEKEILENKNVAAAIIAAAVILGVSIIIAASMLG